jgi:hypothetical protein
MTSQELKIWLTSYEYIKSLLVLYRRDRFWMTGNQSWNLMKWNACGAVMVSRTAIEMFLKDSTLDKNSRAIDFGGAKGARCFVAEHIFPTKGLQALVLDKYSNKDPEFEEFVELFRKYNRICYVWHIEDQQLTQSGLRSSIPIQSNPLSRYEEVKICPLPTKYFDGRKLFKYLDHCRSLQHSIEQVIGDLE